MTKAMKKLGSVFLMAVSMGGCLSETGGRGPDVDHIGLGLQLSERCDPNQLQITGNCTTEGWTRENGVSAGVLVPHGPVGSTCTIFEPGAKEPPVTITVTSQNGDVVADNGGGFGVFTCP